VPARRDDAVLDRRTLNRALLERQMLLRRWRVPALDGVERLVGLQAQVPRDPYVALWSRLDRFRPAALAEPMADRRAVRMTLLRGTLHLVTAADAIALRPAIQPVVERMLRSQAAYRTAVDGIDLDELLGSYTDLLEEAPRTRAQLGEAIASRYPGRDATALSLAMYLVPTVQVTPRGVWGQTGPSAFTTVEAWLGRPVDDAADLGPTILRYLAAFGPSTVADAQSWSGLASLKPVFEGLRPRLRTFRDERGRELFDVQGGPLPDPDVPAPVRFLPEYDNVALGHKDRGRIVPDGVPQWTEVGWGGVLVDGFGAARWRLDIDGDGGTLRIEAFGTLSRPELGAVAEEGARLAAFLAPDAARRDVRFGEFAGVGRR
jgi:Winged helix DNA-binding domain